MLEMQEHPFGNDAFLMTSDSSMTLPVDQWVLSTTELEDDVFQLKHAGDDTQKPTWKMEQRETVDMGTNTAFIDKESHKDKPVPDISDLAYFCACFFALFAGFLPCQNLLTTIFGNVGYWALFILYTCFTVSILYSPLVIQILNLQVVLFSCSCLVVVFVISILVTLTNPEQLKFVLFASCTLLGSAFGPLWLAQGVYIGRIVQDIPQIVGKFNGTFLSTYFLAGISGNLLITFIAYFVQPFPSAVIFGILLIFCTTGSTLFVFLKEPQSKMLDVDTKNILPHTLAMAKERTILLMTPYSIGLGLTSTFAWGTLPTLLPRMEFVPILGCLYGVSNLMCCACAGYVFDRFGWIPLGIYNLFALLISMLTIAVAHSYQVTWLFLLGALLLGSLEGVENTIIQSTYMKHSS